MTRFNKSSTADKLQCQIYQYAILPQWVEAARKDDPEGVYELKTESSSYAKATFKHLYVAPGGCRKYWEHDGRLMVSMDGCHVSVTWTETLLTVVAKDGNGELHLLAFMICHGESKETYKTLMMNMRRDFVQFDESLVMCDRAQGSETALPELQQAIANCTRHMRGNSFLSGVPMTVATTSLLGMLAKTADRERFHTLLEDFRTFPGVTGAVINGLVDKAPMYATYAFAENNRMNFIDVTSNDAESYNNVLEAERTMVISFPH